MTMLTIPASLAAAAVRDHHGRRREWLAALPTLVAELAGRWSLQIGEPFQPGGDTSWVAPARAETGEDLVLKIGWAHPESEHEADGLRFWDGDGAVRVLADYREGQTGALLLERCRPGTELGQSLSEAAQDEVVAGLLRRLWMEPPTDHRFRPLQQMCDAWAARAEEKLARNPRALDPGLVRDGLLLFRSLPASADRDVVLCTDLHAGNILAAQREPWLVIDPKPYVGDPAYDALQHMLNCEDRLLADPAGLARRMADLLDLDADRVVQWLFGRAVQECVEWPVMAAVAERLAPT